MVGVLLVLTFWPLLKNDIWGHGQAAGPAVDRRHVDDMAGVDTLQHSWMPCVLTGAVEFVLQETYVIVVLGLISLTYNL
jgi:hypothetical protein